MTKTQNKRYTPNPLNQFIKLANLMYDNKIDKPPDPSDLESAFGGWAKYQYHLRRELNKDTYLNIFFERFKKTEFWKEWNLKPHIAMYQLFWTINKTLLALAGNADKNIQLPTLQGHPNIGIQVNNGTMQFSAGGQYYKNPARFILGKPFTLEKNSYEVHLLFLNSMHGHLARIKKCPICHKFFWAKRTDSPACPGKCGNYYRQMIYRKSSDYKGKAKNYEAYKRKR